MIGILDNNGIMYSIEFSKDIERLDELFGRWIILLVNDDINDIGYVIDTLKNICNITDNQAMSVAILAHLNGKSIIDYGDKSKIFYIGDQLLEAGLQIKYL